MRSHVILPLLIVASPALAAEADQPTDFDLPADMEEEVISDDIVVVATRMAGQVDTDVPPIMTLDEADITSYGAASIGELLEAISPQTSSGRGRGGGRPIILLNGQRIANFRQIRDIPPEAIRRTEVLPEEVALKFGYAPDSRVVNFILKDNFSSVQLAGEYNMPARGGFTNTELEAGLVNINGPRRFNLNWKTVDDSLLTEAERGIIQSDGDVTRLATDPDPAEFRSLVSDSVTHTLTGSWSTGLGEEGMGGTLTLDGELSRNDSRSLQGLDSIVLSRSDGSSLLRSLPGALERDVRSDSYEAGLTFNKPLGAWQFTATADSVYTDTTTRTDREADLTYLQDAVDAGLLSIDGPLTAPTQPGRDLARSKLWTVSSAIALMGNPVKLPAGDVSLTFDAGIDHLNNRTNDTRSLIGARSLSREIYSVGANLSVPLTGGRDNFMDDIGDVSLNFSGGLHHFSDFGSLFDWNAGIIWSPFDKLTLNASYMVSEVAPSVGQLGDPEVVTVNVPVFDFATGEAVLASVITGGNPLLLAERQRDIKISANYELPILKQSRLVVEYFRNRSDDVTRSFPLLTPAIEAAFPGRVVRDASGRLISIDRRPVTFSKVESEHVRWGINLSGNLGAQQAPGGNRAEGVRGPGGARAGGGGPEAGGPPGGFRGVGFGPGGQRNPGGRWNLAVYHTWRFSDRVTIAPGMDALDQLAGDALVAGGVPRHQIELEGGLFRNNMGLRFNGTWTAPADVLASGGPGSSDLRFGSVFDLGARVFFNLGSMPNIVEKMPFLKGVRISFEFDNLLDSRQRVTDASGEVPLAYQPGLQDPRGRFIGVDIKKSF